MSTDPTNLSPSSPRSCHTDSQGGEGINSGYFSPRPLGGEGMNSGYFSPRPPGGEGINSDNSPPRPLGGEGGERSEPGEGVMWFNSAILSGCAVFSGNSPSLP